jgi:hypothetical protein
MTKSHAGGGGAGAGGGGALTAMSAAKAPELIRLAARIAEKANLFIMFALIPCTDPWLSGPAHTQCRRTIARPTAGIFTGSSRQGQDEFCRKCCFFVRFFENHDGFLKAVARGIHLSNLKLYP